MEKIRPIVRAAFRCDELAYQFTRIDVEDGVLPGIDVRAEVNQQYADDYILREAKNCLDISLENVLDCSNHPEEDEYKMHRREALQLQKFIAKFS